MNEQALETEIVSADGSLTVMMDKNIVIEAASFSRTPKLRLLDLNILLLWTTELGNCTMETSEVLAR